MARPTNLGRVTFLECDVGISTVADLSLLEDLLDLKYKNRAKNTRSRVAGE